MINNPLSNYFISFFGIVIGLTVFLIGTKLLSTTFRTSVSFRLKALLQKTTSNKLLGVLIGIVATGLLQSSSATTIIVISLVHSGLITLYGAVPIIMGANIGTTITAQLVAFNFGESSPYLIALIIFFLFIFKAKNNKFAINILLGLTLIFLGIEFISISISSFKTVQFFTRLIVNIEDNRIISIFLGCIITATIQSSSTGIAILQIMASKGIISVSSALPIMLGQNIGTCANTLVGSIATNKVGKQAALIHIIFNVIGVIVFFFALDWLYNIVKLISPNNPGRQIANAHTLFNITSTFLLLPFSSVLVTISKKIIRD
ncbi:Na/Pi cotransporter family protein [Sporosalibacterium faouarense]|uniref:Na/Pi cotransporter family protein n=1 Tax=Sporosalibacterium faouarense TaxID=516123 RepID=UPI00141CC994|nr:Na/Pi symporter [Sporosalibacterium faouarense]MTI49548.1 Na/Pi cotransporter family protein [Bacillota bacterium]